MYCESQEVETLRKMIDYKKKEFGNPKTPDFVKRILQREILFLQNDIMPIVQKSTILFCAEVQKLFLRYLETAIKFKCNGLLVYMPINDAYKERPIIGIGNCRDEYVFGKFKDGAIDIFCNQVEIYNKDGGGIDNVEIFVLPIDGLL